MDSECEAKLKGMQKYVPFLGNLIETLSQDSSKEAKLSQMQLLLKLLTKPDVGITIDTLTKCEQVLDKVFGSSQQSNAARSSLDEPPASNERNSNSPVLVNIKSECVSDDDDDDYNGVCKALSVSKEVVEGNCEESAKDCALEEAVQNSNHVETTEEKSVESSLDAESDSNGKANSPKSPPVQVSTDIAPSSEIGESDQEKDAKLAVEPESCLEKNTVDEPPIQGKLDVEVRKDVIDGEEDDIKMKDICSETKSESQAEDEKSKTEKLEDEVISESEIADKDPSEQNGRDNKSENNDDGNVTTINKENSSQEDCEVMQEKVEEVDDTENSKNVNEESGEKPIPDDIKEGKDEVSEEEEIKSKASCEANGVEEEVEREIAVKSNCEESDLNNPSEEIKSPAKDEIASIDESSEVAKSSNEDNISEEVSPSEALENSTVAVANPEELPEKEEIENEEEKVTDKKKDKENDIDEKKTVEIDDDNDLLVEIKRPDNANFTQEKESPPIKRLGSVEIRRKVAKIDESIVKENSTIKAIELKPKNPSEKPAVVYLVKKGTPKPMETIELLDSESEDDDVIIVSEVGLKKKPSTVPKPIVQKRVAPAKFPQPKVVGSSSSHNNKPMFAITSVKSINQQRSVKTVSLQKGLMKVIVSPTKAPPQQSKLLDSTPMKRTSIMAQPMIQKPTAVSKSPITPLQRTNSLEKIKPVPPSPKFTPGRVSRDSTLDDSTSDADSSKSNLSQAIEDPRAMEWVQNFLNHLVSPTQNVTPFGMELVQKVLDFQTFCKVRAVIEENRKKYGNMKFDPPEGSSRHDDIKELFIKNGSLTELGSKLAFVSKQTSNKVYTTDRRNGNTTSRSRCKKPKELEDDEYAPTVCVEFAQETVADRRKSLRRESKTNRKQYFAYEDDDDTEFLEMLEEHARIEANANKKKKLAPKRTNGAPRNQVKVKKMRLEEGFSVDTPFETDLLTPTWVEGPVDPDHAGQFPELDDQMQTEVTYDDAENCAVQDNQEQEPEAEPEQQQEVEEEESSESSRVAVDPDKPFKNINRAHHCRSRFIDACVLCNIKHNFVVAHYVNQHRDSEVLIARLTQRDTDQLVKSVNCGYLAATKSTAYQYSATCVFCKREMCFALRYWWEHYTMHTGEYGYECSKCSLRRPRRQHAQKHANNECKFGEAQVKIIYHFDKTMNEIAAFICNLCNYIQLHRENVVKHLRTQHDLKKDISANITGVVLLQISRPYQESAPGQDAFNHSYDYENSRQYTAGENSYQSYESNPNDDYMQYSGDDLSFMICDMLSTEEPAPAAAHPIEAIRDSNLKQGEETAAPPNQDMNPTNTQNIKVKAESTSSQ